MTNEQGKTPIIGELKPGDRIGKYEVRRLLGAGGQSVVYQAYDALLDRNVAIKQIAPHLAQDPRYVQTLRENLRKLARLGQKNEAVVTIHEILEDPRGLFYVMEFVEGHTLETLIRESGGPMEPKAVLLIVFRLAAALHDVHNEGIVHRDMKPGNIILTEGLRPKIVDFGIAAVGPGDVSMPLATTKYLAPELYSGAPADARADLYSLGFMAYEMLLGRTKFNEVFADVVRDPHSEALRWMKWHGNESVSAPPLHEVNSAVPQALSQIVAQLIQKDPTRRFASAEDLGRAIKGSFSAKSRLAGTKVAASSAPQRLSHEVMGSLEGDDLEIESVETPGRPAAVEPEGPATVPLPKGPMSRRKKLVLALAGAAVFLALASAGIAWMVHLNRLREAQAMSAAGLFDSGSEFYKTGQYDKALEKFEALIHRHSATLQGTKAAVLAPMCRAHLAVANRQWRQAQLFEEDAKTAAENLQETSKSPSVEEWVRQQETAIQELSRSRLSSNTFWNAVKDVEENLPKAVGEKDFDAMLEAFRDAVGAPDVVLTPQQEAEAARREQDILRRKFNFLFDRCLARGDTLLQENRYDAADAAYAQAAAMLSVQDEMIRAIPPEQRSSRLAVVQRKRADVQTRRRSDQAGEAIRQAEKAGDQQALKAALREALKVEGLPAAQQRDYQDRLREMDVVEAVDSARRRLAEGKYDQAQETLNQALRQAPGDARLTALAKEVQAAGKRAGFIQAGDRAALKRDFAEALKQYNQAAELGSDEALAGKILDMQYEIEVQRGNDLMQAGRYDQAEEAYQKARKIKPSSSAQVEALLVLLRTQREYGELLAQGDRQREKKNWREAIRLYNRAKQRTQDSREVDGRIGDTNYQKYLYDGKEALREKNYAVARWNFKQALHYKDTPEARSLLDQAGGEETVEPQR